MDPRRIVSTLPGITGNIVRSVPSFSVNLFSTAKAWIRPPLSVGRSAVGISSKGCVTFSGAKVVDYESFKANCDGELVDLIWLFAMNRGIYMTPGREEEWTLSVQHSFADADRYIAMFDELAYALVS